MILSMMLKNNFHTIVMIDGYKKPYEKWSCILTSHFIFIPDNNQHLIIIYLIIFQMHVCSGYQIL